MANAFDFYRPSNSQALKDAWKGAAPDREAAQGARGRLDAAMAEERRQASRGLGGTMSSPPSAFAGAGVARARAEYNAAQSRADRGNHAENTDVLDARDQMNGMTAGISDKVMNDPQVAAALAHLQGNMASGPYTDGVKQQIVNRNADQSAAAEAANADELRNTAAARGIDPTNALRAGQAQRQQSNIAFQGDMDSRAALTNYDAQQNAARSLAQGRLAQFGQAQPGYAQAANYAAQTQFTGGRTSAVGGNNAPSLAFGGRANNRTPFGAQSQQMNGNQSGTRPMPVGGMPANGAIPGSQPGQAPAPAPRPVRPPVVYGNTPFGPVSPAQNARSYQNIYKYTN